MRTIGSGRRVQRVNPPGRDAESAPTRYQESFNAPSTVVDQTWTCPKSGFYTVYAWGPGGRGGLSGSQPAGGSGALAVWSRLRFGVGETVTITIPALGATTGDTVVATASKAVNLTAGRGAEGGSGGAGGVAAGGDLNINGTAGLSSGTGNPGGGDDGGTGGVRGSPGAPGTDGYRGGNGVENFQAGAGTPGAGGAYSGSVGDPFAQRGHGLVIICRDS